MNARKSQRGRSTYQVFAVFLAGLGLVIACGSSSSNDDVNGAGSSDDGGSSSGNNPNGGEAGSNPDGSSGGANSCVVNTCPTNVKCDATLGCVECLADGDCTANGRDPFCVVGHCVACRTNTDCGVAAPACYPGDHQCHLACNPDAGQRCPRGVPICDSTTGACIECNSKTDCTTPGAPLCDPNSKTCVSCLVDTDCPATAKHCSPTELTCVQCIVSSDCPTGQRCTTGGGLPGILGGAGRCVPGCTADSQCADQATNKKCDLASGNCVQCNAATDCAAPATQCAGHRCAQCQRNADCADAGAAKPFCFNELCVQCRFDNDCPGGNKNCNNGVCQ